MDFETRISKAKKSWDRLQNGDLPVIYIGAATCGLAAGAGDLLDIVDEELAGLKTKARVVSVGCIGMCYAEPFVDVQLPGRSRVTYDRVDARKLRSILKSELVKGKPHSGHAMGYIGDAPVDGIGRLFDLPVLASQVRIATRNCGIIDPLDLDHYLARGGYRGLQRALSMTPEDVIREVLDSGLRGRGGGGFPTGQKWKFCRNAPGDQKYLICNADEGDPGAFMDRSVLEGDPHSVLEGMCIAAYALGAATGYVYIRAEYPLAIGRLLTALGQMKKTGLLGRNILGSGFDFDILIKEGAGAFVCGEETALMASIEGHRGMPRPRPPFPATKGLFGKPTNINNVETLANVPTILREGAEAFARLGTAGSKGTKTFALTGKINNSGLIEVPMGITLDRVINEIGGGVLGNGKFKAAQTGGPSGGCLPARLKDLPIEYETLAKAGSIMGSGGLVIMDESTCMVDLARYFLAFTQKESCGECTPCRIGTRRMLDILEKICAGKGEPGDITELETLGRVIKDTALCGLGQTAPNPVLTTLRYFREEYEEHIFQKHCRAAVCTALVVSPCHHSCPAGVKAHRYVREVAQGNFENAYLVVRENMPLPSVCGTVCFHPCESRCRRGQLDDPIAIRALKDAAVRFGRKAEERTGPPAARTGKKVAVVGSGPAGLTAAYYLSKVCGHDVTIFEKLPVVGGMLHTGIPRYRLPAGDLEHDINIVRAAGVKIRTRTEVSSVAELKQQGFDAVFLSLGAHMSWNLGVDGETSEGVFDCIAFLRDVSLGKRPAVGQRVGVVGGGNSAIDAARTALRLGAREVVVLYRRTQDAMPADESEIEEALHEGVQIRTLVLPQKIRRTRQGLEVTLQDMELSDVDESGRRRPVPVRGSEHAEVFDSIIGAIGQFPEIPRKLEVAINDQSRCIQVPDRQLSTTVDGVFAGGDVVLGPASVVEAIGQGRAAAEAIDRYLGGTGNIEETLAPPENTQLLPPMETETGERKRLAYAFIAPSKRTSTFDRVEKGYSKQEAMREASRCLRCDLQE